MEVHVGTTQGAHHDSFLSVHPTTSADGLLAAPRHPVVVILTLVVGDRDDDDLAIRSLIANRREYFLCLTNRVRVNEAPYLRPSSIEFSVDG